MTESCHTPAQDDKSTEGCDGSLAPLGESARPVIDEPTVISRRPPVHSLRGNVPLGARELGQTLAGRNLAHFQLLEFVGGGGMGAVFRATDTMLNRTVAVKVLSRDQGRDEETVKRFQNEAQSAARLDHENIARVYYVGEDDGWYFIVFEFIDGRNLRELVDEQGPMPVGQAIQVTLQIAEALDHSAKREVVHRDIKPSNVLLTRTGKAKLVDMGLARLRPLRPNDEDLTASGVTLGTFDYISPEQARDPRTADARSDIYSLGCTLYFMLTGQPPFPDGTVLQKLLSHSSDAAPDPRRLRPDLPPELVPLMNRMLAKKPSDRHARPIDLVADLLVVADRLGLSTSTSGQAIWVTPKPTIWNRIQFHLPWSLAVALLLLAALFWDPEWLDGSTRDSAAPRPLIVVPVSGQGADPSVSSNDRSPINGPSERTAAGDASKTAAKASPGSISEMNHAEEPSDRVPTPGGADPSGTGETVTRSSESESLATHEVTGTGTDGTERPGIDQPRRAGHPGDAKTSVVRTLVVDTSPTVPRVAGERVVGDLAEAFRMALQSPTIDTIQIRKSGRFELAPLVLHLAGRSFRLGAAPGYSPTLSFRTGISVSDLDSEGMIQVTGGTLEVEGIHLEMTVPNETLEGEWSLFHLADAAAVRIRRSTIVVHNSYGGRFSNLDDVAVFNCVVPDREDMLAPDMGQPREPIEVSLTDCVIRCEATVLRAREAIPIRFQWRNGLLISSDRLAILGGSVQSPRDGERIELDLQQVTAMVDQGLAEVTSSAARGYLMPVLIHSRSCIWSTQRLTPLIAQSGPHSMASFMSQFEYRGDQNAYEGMDSLWKISSQDGSQVETFDFEQWRSQWNEDRATWQQVTWRYPIDKTRPIHESQVSDFGLNIPMRPSIGESAPSELTGFQSGTLPSIPDPGRSRPQKTRPSFQR